MYVSIFSILLSLGAKCLLDWSLVFVQQKHIFQSFLGVFSLSLAVVDSVLTLTVISLHICSDTHVVLLGLHLTRYHVCLLVQILGQVYRVLQWPVVVMAALDHFRTVRCDVSPSNTKRFMYLLVLSFLWYVAVFYVFLLSDFIPVLEDVSPENMHRCWVFHSSHILQIAVLLLLTLGFTALYARRPQQHLINHPVNNQTTEQSQTHSRRSFVHQTLCIFFNTWTLFLLTLAVLLLLVGIPSYLDLNVAWLCFLNSLLIAFVLCAVCPASQISQNLAVVPPDSFCEWRFSFSSGHEDKT